MTETVVTMNLLLAFGGLMLLSNTVVLAYDLYTNRSFAAYVRKYGIVGAFALAGAGSALTLVYSEIFGFVPCGLCWLQRVFLYPQMFILGTALVTKDRTVALYGIVLSIPGLLVSLYQHYLQMGGTELIDCPAAAGDCTKQIMLEFGFMTFPLLSASLFAFLIVLFWYIRKIS